MTSVSVAVQHMFAIVTATNRSILSDLWPSLTSIRHQIVTSPFVTVELGGHILPVASRKGNRNPLASSGTQTRLEIKQVLNRNIMMLQSMEVSDAVYNCHWYLADTRLGKDLLLVQTR